MIQYESVDAPFFMANKDYCILLEKALETMKADVSGYCNSYGYEIDTSFRHNGLACKLKCSKHQSTQNGVVIPVNAIDAGSISLLMSGFDTRARLHLGKSAVKRLLAPADVKKKLPAPYFLHFNTDPASALLDRLVDFVGRYQVVKLKLERGTLKCEIHQPQLKAPLAFLADIEALIRDWK